MYKTLDHEKAELAIYHNRHQIKNDLAYIKVFNLMHCIFALKDLKSFKEIITCNLETKKLEINARHLTFECEDDLFDLDDLYDLRFKLDDCCNLFEHLLNFNFFQTHKLIYNLLKSYNLSTEPQISLVTQLCIRKFITKYNDYKPQTQISYYHAIKNEKRFPDIKLISDYYDSVYVCTSSFNSITFGLKQYIQEIVYK